MGSPVEVSSRRTLDIQDYGAVGDGQTNDVQALQAAVEACRLNSGGMLSIAPGTYRTGSLFLCSSLTLNLESGACLPGSQDREGYPVIPLGDQPIQ